MSSPLSIESVQQAPMPIRAPSLFGRYGGMALTALLGIAGLYLVFIVYAVGQTLLAGTLLIIVTLAF